MGKKEKKIECEEYDALVKSIEDAKAQVKAAAKGAVAALLRKFFAEYPDVKALGWTQYTPYHNDGEPCEFSVREFYACTKDGVDFAEVSEIHDEDEGEFRSSWSLRDSDRRTAAGLDALERSASGEVFEAAFGDHVMVIATTEGFHINEYDHE